MSADVCSVLGPEVSECLTTVVEKHGSDGSGCTVLDCLAARDLLSGDRAVCLVCLMHTPVHHRNVLARLGVPKPETHAALYFVDALSQVGSISGCSADDLFSQVTKAIASAQVSSKAHISLILDDISVLLDIGWDLQQVISFLNRLRSLKLASMAVLTHTAGADTLTSLLASALIHASDTAVSVLPLSTGVSTDVSGTLIIRHLQQPNDMPQSFHFRLMDKQVLPSCSKDLVARWLLPNPDAPGLLLGIHGERTAQEGESVCSRQHSLNFYKTVIAKSTLSELSKTEGFII